MYPHKKLFTKISTISDTSFAFLLSPFSDMFFATRLENRAFKIDDEYPPSLKSHRPSCLKGLQVQIEHLFSKTSDQNLFPCFFRKLKPLGEYTQQQGID